jgi:F-type H+-transporting ATPase subunit b
MQIDPLTFLFELVNFVVLAWLLHRWVYRPVAAAIAERRREIDETRALTKQRLADVEERSVALDARDRELDRLRETVMAEASSAAAVEGARLLDEARAGALSERARVQTMLDAEREAALGWVREVAVDRGAEVAGHLLLSLVPDAAHDALMKRLLEKVAASADVLRKDATDDVIAAEATFAHMPDQPDSTELQRVLEEALGRSVRMSISADGRLGAGATLRVCDRVFDASVQGQLEVLREDARAYLEARAS